MAYSDNDNEYFSDTYNDEISTKDEIINDLKKLSNKNDIKALRQYIIINRRKLKNYKTRLLNDVVNVKGYKFLRRDGKLIIVKISPSSKYYKPDDSKVSNSEYAPSNADFESLASYADFDGFSETTPALSKPAISNIQTYTPAAKPQQKPAINSFQEADNTAKALNEPSNVDLLNAANNDKTTAINPEEKAEDIKLTDKAYISKLTDKPINETHEVIPEIINSNSKLEMASLNNTPELTSILNSIYKQANEQNENQRTQYERLTKTLNDSIQAKSQAEQEQINKFNNVIATIERTFSAGTFDSIIEHIDNMVSQFVRNQEAKNNDFNNKLEYIDNDISELLNTTKQQQEAIDNLEDNKSTDSIEDNETINELNITIDELTEKIQEQEDTISSLKSGFDKLIKQHADLINKLSLAVYNIDEGIYNQIFNKQAQEEKATTED